MRIQVHTHLRYERIQVHLTLARGGLASKLGKHLQQKAAANCDINL
jgi:hypothetical protein